MTRSLGSWQATAGPVTAREWWLTVKPLVRRIESEEGMLIVDYTIIEKPHSKENPIVCWHYDHSKQRNVKGINLLSGALLRGDRRRQGAAPECAALLLS